MDDYYVYYELSQFDGNTGIIKAVSPRPIKEVADLEFIRIEADFGLQFISGDQSFNYWHVTWSNELQEMHMAKVVQEKPSAPVLLREIPTEQDDPHIILTWMGTHFNVWGSKDVAESSTKDMWVFVTRYQDPNVPYMAFEIPVDGIDAGFNVDADLPDEFSVYTRHSGRFLLRVQT